MIHNEDPGVDNTYLFGQSELARYYTIERPGHRAAAYQLREPPYSLADVQYSGHRQAAYTPFGGGLSQNDDLQPEVSPYELRAQGAPGWCGSSAYQAALAALCALDGSWCTGGVNANCLAVTNDILDPTCRIFTGGMNSPHSNSGFSDGQIRQACQCNTSTGVWEGPCQGGIPCTGGGGGGGGGGGTGIDTNTLLLVAGVSVAALLGLFLLTTPGGQG